MALGNYITISLEWSQFWGYLLLTPVDRHFAWRSDNWVLKNACESWELKVFKSLKSQKWTWPPPYPLKAIGGGCWGWVMDFCENFRSKNFCDFWHSAFYGIKKFAFFAKWRPFEFFGIFPFFILQGMGKWAKIGGLREKVTDHISNLNWLLGS